MFHKKKTHTKKQIMYITLQHAFLIKFIRHPSNLADPNMWYYGCTQQIQQFFYWLTFPVTSYMIFAMLT